VGRWLMYAPPLSLSVHCRRRFLCMGAARETDREGARAGEVLRSVHPPRIVHPAGGRWWVLRRAHGQDDRAHWRAGRAYACEDSRSRRLLSETRCVREGGPVYRRGGARGCRMLHSRSVSLHTPRTIMRAPEESRRIRSGTGGCSLSTPDTLSAQLKF